MPVGVLVEAPLPGVIGVGKIGFNPKNFIEDVVIGKLFAIVISCGLDHSFVTFEKPVDRCSNIVGLLARRECHEGVFAHPVHDGDQHRSAGETNDGIHLQIAQADLLFNDGRTLIYRNTMLETTSFVFGVSPSFALSTTLPQVGVKGPAARLVCVNMKIDRFMADTMIGVLGEKSADLLGTPLLLNKVTVHHHPKGRRFSCRRWRAGCLTVGLSAIGAISLANHAISSDLPGDR